VNGNCKAALQFLQNAMTRANCFFIRFFPPRETRFYFSFYRHKCQIQFGGGMRFGGFLEAFSRFSGRPFCPALRADSPEGGPPV
ncbi:MAG: hypothetical protein II932_05375, partial [Treponema sp.]|nr:hypothetical protein [Treponema sp.]